VRSEACGNRAAIDAMKYFRSQTVTDQEMVELRRVSSKVGAGGRRQKTDEAGAAGRAHHPT
jgi:hypothetical protein